MSPRRPSIPGSRPMGPGPLAVLTLLGLLTAHAVFAADPLAGHPPFTLSPTELLEAARPAQAPTSAETADAGERTDDQEGVEILYHATSFTFRADGARTHRQYEVYRIDTAAGVEGWSEVSTDYSPWHQERPTLQARVVTPEGRVHPLDPATISEVSLESDLPDVYQDRRRLRAPLPAVEPGAVIETLVEVVDKAPLFAAGTVHRELLAALVPVRHLTVTLDSPESLGLRHVVALPAAGPGSTEPVEPLEPTVTHAGGRVRQAFDLHGVAPLSLPAPGLPTDEPRYPYVAFTTGRSWADLARAYSQVVDAQIAASDLGNVEIPGEGLGSQWEQIAARVAWMQRSVRYTGVNLGEAAIVPRPPAQTLARRYGDCKDKATLLVAVLRDLGVPAYVALLRAGSPDDIDAELPGLGAGGFDHAIVYVPGSPALWIDATDPYSVLGELPTPDQGRLALVASPNTDRLILTPRASADDNRVEKTREVTLVEFGSGRVVETSRMTGAPARELRASMAGATEVQIAKNLASYAGSAGRQFRAGFDRAGAIEALERARELAPDKVEMSINLALLHEYDDRGRRYLDPDELAVAIDTYRSVEDQLAGTRYINNLALDLLFAGRNQEAFDLLEDKASDPAAAGLLAAAEALVKSPRAAIRRTDRTFAADGTQRAQALVTGGQMLAGRRHYPEATQLLRAASASSGNPAQLQGYIRLIERARPWQEVPIDPESPASLVQQLILAALSKDEVEPADLAGLLSDAWQNDLSSRFLADLIDDELEISTDGDAAALGAMTDAMFDLVFASGELVPEELPGIGWAVHLDTDLPVPDKDKGMIVVREDGSFRYAASEDKPASLGHNAMALARKGSIEGARPWLDHAFELTEAPEDWKTLPSAGELFHEVWASADLGPGAGTEESGHPEAGAAADRDRIELAAAVLSSSDFADGQVVEVLRRARDSATEDDSRIALDYALADALMATESYEEALEVGRRLEEETEEDVYVVACLRRLERYDELLERIGRKLEDDPDDLRAAILRGQALLDQGKLDEAAAAYETMLERPNPPALIFNQAAWVAVARDAVDERAVQWGQRAVQETDYADDVNLHTLATVYAEAGRPEEAHKVILQAIEARPDKETEPVDWYVFGRIAEQYGLTEAAREYYRKVEAPDDGPTPVSTWTFAQRRLKGLGG